MHYAVYPHSIGTEKPYIPKFQTSAYKKVKKVWQRMSFHRDLHEEETREEFVCNYAHGSLFAIFHARLYAHSDVSYAGGNPKGGIASPYFFRGFRGFWELLKVSKWEWEWRWAKTVGVGVGVGVRQQQRGQNSKVDDGLQLHSAVSIYGRPCSWC